MAIKTGEKMYADDINNLTFFPKGTILTFSSEAWGATSATFRNIWKICDGQHGTPNLMGRFLCGGSASGSIGGADSQDITLGKNNLPAHSHGVNQSTHTGMVSGTKKYGGSGVFAGSSTSHTAQSGSGAGIENRNYSFSLTTAVSIKDEGNGQKFTVNTVPSYYTVLYIMKVS